MEFKRDALVYLKLRGSMLRSTFFAWPFAVLLTASPVCLAQSSGLSASPSVDLDAARAVSTSISDDPPEATSTQTPGPQANFFQRLGKAYLDDWKPTPPGAHVADPPKTRFPSPLDSIPFPSSDFSVGGTPIIGAPDTQTYILMQAINQNKSRTKVYGWFNGGFNISSSNKGDGANAPASYYVNPNRITADQEVLYVERLPDTVQTQHFDWGFRLAQLYGQDYRYTTSKGVLSQQLLARNHENGYDPVMYYLDLYFPHVAQGMNVRVGRYISLPDIEAQLAPNNYTYSHSLLYTVDPYTQTGVVASIKFNEHWLLQLGFSDGNDVAIWTPDVKPTGTACVDYTWHKGSDALYTCANSFNDGKYAYNNLQSYYETWYHKFNAHWHTDTETWYMYERQVPNIAGNVTNPIAPEVGANGAICSYGERTCFAPEVAVVNYVEYEKNSHNYFSFRNEFVDDLRGQRTGYATKYSEHLISWGHWIGSTVLFRPEIRFERSYDMPAYDLGTKKNQFVFAADMTYHF
jgi:hypothetical protein